MSNALWVLSASPEAIRQAGRSPYLPLPTRALWVCGWEGSLVTPPWGSPPTAVVVPGGRPLSACPKPPHSTSRTVTVLDRRARGLRAVRKPGRQRRVPVTLRNSGFQVGHSFQARGLTQELTRPLNPVTATCHLQGTEGCVQFQVRGGRRRPCLASVSLGAASHCCDLKCDGGKGRGC